MSFYDKILRQSKENNNHNIFDKDLKVINPRTLLIQ